MKLTADIPNQTPENQGMCGARPVPANWRSSKISN